MTDISTLDNDPRSKPPGPESFAQELRLLADRVENGEVRGFMCAYETTDKAANGNNIFRLWDADQLPTLDVLLMFLFRGIAGHPQ